MRYFESKRLGIPWVPGTFPTLMVTGYILVTYPHLKDNWTSRKVQTLYDWYKDAVLNKKLPPYVPGAGDLTKTVQYITQKSGHSEAEVRIFLMALKTLSELGKIDSKYYTMNIGALAPKDPTNPFKNPSEALNKMATSLKIVGILGLVGVGIYFTWPILKRLRKRA